MEEIILSATEDEGIASLYSLIRGDPDFLQTFDRSQFADTPLHRAAGEGRTQLALEIQRLMPSFGRKLNPDGLTPVDLAMRRGHRQTVRALVKLSPELVGVQGREGITPLHYAAETDDAELLEEFLFRCPKSVEERTVREESAVHVAVKNRKLAAVRVLVRWLQKTGRLNVTELLTENVNVYGRNGRNSTALDTVTEIPTEMNTRALQILHRVPRGSAYADLVITSDHRSRGVISKFNRYLESGLSHEMRSNLLVVAVLIVTATYQAAINPPGGPTNNHAPISDRSEYFGFITSNSIAFALSLGMIMLMLPVRRYNILLHVSLYFLMYSYLSGMHITWPHSARILSIAIFLFMMVSITKWIFVLNELFGCFTK
ncbi:hypothetical protein ABFS83_05G109700 [Erythranthe nasuta]